MSTLRTLVAAALVAVVASGCLPATRRMSPSASMPSASAGSASERLAAAYDSPSLSYDRRSLLRTAETWLGVPYSYGGNSRSGIDCSGFVCSVFGALDVRLPRTSSQQSGAGQAVTLYDALPGDLVFFNTSGSGVSHVGILINSSEFVHASTSKGVIVSSLGEKYYRERLVSVRRVLEDAM
ncbi:MAG TPA: C40 family peptidase [Candidatus Kapabacteria bacterium]|jgi:probable lipoprotein NlpC|nr:C40 family peptidase [Candidatus Kapabacteria bacterium]